MTTPVTSAHVRWDERQQCQFEYLRLLATRLDQRQPTQTEVVRRAMSLYEQHLSKLLRTQPDSLRDEFKAFEKHRKPADCDLTKERLHELVVGGETIKPLSTLIVEEAKRKFAGILARPLPVSSHNGRR